MKQKSRRIGMNSVRNDLDHAGRHALRRTVLSFTGYALLASLFCLLSRLWFLTWETELVWQITPHAGSTFLSALLGQTECVILLAVRYFFTFTAFSVPFSFFSAVFAGSCIGCAAAFLERGILSGIAPPDLSAAFGILLVYLLLCSVSDLYARYILTVTGLGEHRLRVSLIGEYTVLCGVFSGIILLSGILAAVYLP